MSNDLVFEGYKEQGERTFLVNIETMSHNRQITEFTELAVSAGANIIYTVSVRVINPNAKYFLGLGKVEQLADYVRTMEIDLLIINHNLTPSQEKNLEQYFKCRVIDRTRLILDIFASRAATYEGKLQVELAQLEYLRTRLVRGWTHLERQKGGIGLRGPGETQLESDRRMLRNKVSTIKSRLEKVSSQRSQARKSRKRNNIPIVSVTGYTNAGKSTLFNTLTNSNVYAQDKLFATLDPTIRHLDLPTIGRILLVDTVGFIQDLPHNLIDAFKATLEETQNADLLLHIIDAHSSEREMCIAEVMHVLKEIGASDIPIIEVYNKIDLLSHIDPFIEYDSHGMPIRVYISGLQNLGLNLLLESVVKTLSQTTVSITLSLAPNRLKVRARLFELNAIRNEKCNDNCNLLVNIELPTHQWNIFKGIHNIQDTEILNPPL